MAKSLNSEVNDVVKAGITLAFVSYPSAVLEMEMAPLWSSLFFLMLINLSLSSVCGGVQMCLAFIIDEKPSLAKHRTWIVVGLCLVFFLLGLPMCTNAGILLFTVFDQRCASCLLFVCLLEMIHVAWFYGTDQFFENLAEMGMNMNGIVRLTWTLLWKLVAPVLLAFITVSAWVKHEPMAYENDEFPASIETLGWIIELLPLSVILFYPIIPIYHHAWKEGLRGENLYKKLFKPSDEWYTIPIEMKSAEL